jgi:hypothetical protein
MTTIKYTLALNGHLSIIVYTTTNQKHAEMANEGMDRRWDRGGGVGDVEYHCFGGDSAIE